MKIILYALFLLAPLGAYAQRGSYPNVVVRDSSYERLMRFNDTTGGEGDKAREREHWNHPMWEQGLFPSIFMDSPWEFSRRDFG